MALKLAPASEFALVRGVELAKAHDAELQIFHAMDYALQDLDEGDPKLTETNFTFYLYVRQGMIFGNL